MFHSEISTLCDNINAIVFFYGGWGGGWQKSTRHAFPNDPIYLNISTDYDNEVSSAYNLTKFLSLSVISLICNKNNKRPSTDNGDTPPLSE